MSDGAVWALAVIVFLNSLFIVGIAVALFMLNRKLGEMTDLAHPLIDKANTALSQVETMTAQVSERVNLILDQTGRLVEDVSRKVETTTSIAEETIAQPLISAASVMAGLSRGWDTYKTQMAKEKGDAHQ
jgi:uncharacterized protein YoxC